ncbi:NAD-dependent epimerase/dehydratase family protein [Kiritimatiellota bacterium B12222]|nr:NAD-dependent epimerase/dehydratase family protein [Kiritimatiellota bacterium B12222]
MRILVAGTGFTGSRILHQLMSSGHEVWGLNRQGRCEGGFPVLPGDVLAEKGLASLSVLPEMDLLISTLSGTGQQDPAAYRSVYVDGPRRIMDQLRWRAEREAWMLGSTGVYGMRDGAWVDEETEVEPMHRNGEVQVAAEEALRNAADRCSILRLSGLYGPGRTRLIRQALRKRPYLKAEIWSNQIHADDVAGLVTFLVDRDAAAPELLLVSDKEPAQRQEIFSWIRQEMNLLEGVYDEDHSLRAGADRGNKRINSQKMQALGYPLRYPTFRQGLKPLLNVE